MAKAGQFWQVVRGSPRGFATDPGFNPSPLPSSSIRARRTPRGPQPSPPPNASDTPTADPKITPLPPRPRQFVPALTANVGFWATLSLNIPDFTRYAYSQKAQLAGQAIGLPVTMFLFSFLALVVTSATAVIFGAPIADPVAVLSKIGGAGPTLMGLFGLAVATLSTNIAANVVAPANAFVNLNPQKLSFRTGGLIAATIGAAVCPWNLIGSTGGYIFVWLVGYSALLGPVVGIMLVDYFIVRPPFAPSPFQTPTHAARLAPASGGASPSLRQTD